MRLPIACWKSGAAPSTKPLRTSVGRPLSTVVVCENGTLTLPALSTTEIVRMYGPSATRPSVAQVQVHGDGCVGVHVKVPLSVPA